MFYHIYLVYRENQKTKVVYKTTVTNITTAQLTDITNDILYIPVIYTSDIETPLSEDLVLQQKNLVITDAVINITKPTISYENLSNSILLNSNIPNTVFAFGYSSLYQNLNDNKLNLYQLDESCDRVYIIGKVAKHITETFPELNIKIDKTFYSHNSEALVILLQQELSEDINIYSIQQTALKQWTILNNSNKTLYATNSKNETIVIPFTIENDINALSLTTATLSEDLYQIYFYDGITKYYKDITLKNNTLDLTHSVINNIKFSGIDTNKVLITWDTVLYTEEYEIVCNDEIIATTSDTQYEFDVEKYLTYTIGIRAINIFSSSKTTYKTFYKIRKPEQPEVQIHGIDNVAIYFPKYDGIDSLYCYVYGVTYPDKKYEFIGCTHDYKFNLKKEHIEEYDEFVYRYEISDSFSEYSDIFTFIHPTIFNRRITIEYLDMLEHKFLDCLIKWNLDSDAQGYEIFKNGLPIEKLDANTNSFRLPALSGDVICLHSYYGLREAESNIIKVDDIVDKLPINTDIDFNVDSIIDKTITLVWDINEDVFALDIFIFNKQGVLVNNALDYRGQYIALTVPDYDTYTITAQIKRISNPTDITNYIKYIDITTIKAQISNIIEDEINNKLLLKINPIESITNPRYIVEIKDTILNAICLYDYDSINENNTLPIEYILDNPIEIKYKIIGKVENNYYIETAYSDIVPYANDNSISFTATVTQLSNLPKTYGNIIQIDIDDSMSLNKPLVYDIVITTETGKRLTYTVSNLSLDGSFMFGNAFDNNFGLNNSLPLIVDLKELVNATILITGYRFNDSYTIKLDYNYLPLPKITEITKVLVDCKQNSYVYDIEWIQEPKTMYRLIDTKTKKEYEINGSSIHLELEELTQSFLIYSYNISGISNPMVIDIPLLTQPVNINTINGNKEVSMRFDKVSYANEYRLYIDNQEYMSSIENNLLLKQFTGEKDIIVRACYINSIYTVLGLPSIYRYIPKTIDNAYTLDYSLINENKLIRLQIKEDTIEENVKFINFIVLGESNETLYKKVLNIPIDDFKFVYEIPNSNDISLIYAELTNGWEVRRTNIIDLSEGIFRFEDDKGSFGSNFI